MSLPEPIYFPHSRSNIRIDHGSFFVGRPDWQHPTRSDAVRATAFQNAVFRVLDGLNRPGTGGAVIRVIRRISPRRLLIIRPSARSTRDLAHAYVQAATTFDEEAALAPPQGTGQGAQLTNLYVTPRHYDQRSDVQPTMLHELVHVIRNMTGTRVHYPEGEAGEIGALLKNSYENREEYLATIVANVFCSERYPESFAYGYQHGVGMYRMRGSYDRDPFFRDMDDILGRSQGESRFEHLSPAQAEELSRRFVAHPQHGALMRTFKATNPDLFDGVARVRIAPFNPMRDL